MTKAYRHLHLVGATGAIRTAKYDDRDHLVVPVVAMVEGVVWAVNSDVPEFCPATELAETPQQWDGRACFAGHPEDGGTQVTANTPRTLETSFGLVFNTASREQILASRRLTLEAWLDPAKAEKVGPLAADVIRRLRAGETVEVSVGCYVEALQKDGVFNGQEYHGVWTNVVADHLAMLAKNEKGACSVAAGCGAGRTAIRHLVTAKGIQREEMPMSEKKTLRQRFADVFRRAVAGWNQSEIRSEVRDALKQVEPLYSYIDDVWEEDGYVVYCVYAAVPGGQLVFAPEGYPMDPYTTKTYRRDFEMTEEGVVTFADREEVEFVGAFEPIKAAKAALKAACGCGGTQPAEGVMTKEERAAAITALIASPRNTLKDAKELETSPDVVIASLTAADATLKKAEEDKAKEDAATKKAADDAAALEAAKTTPAVETPVAAAAKPQTTEEWLKTAPPVIQTMYAEKTAKDAAEHSALVITLKAASSHLTEEQLKAKSLDELRTLAAFAKVEAPVVDYSGKGVPGPRQAENFTPPNPYERDLKALREHSKVN